LTPCHPYATAPKEEQKLAQNTKVLNGTKLKESGKLEFSSTAEKHTSALLLMKSTPQQPTTTPQKNITANSPA